METILNPQNNKYTLFPIEHHDVYKLYKEAVQSFWTVEEVDMSGDIRDWKTLTSDEQFFIEHVLAFFSNADGIVSENLLARFGVEVTISEARAFYAYQAFNESVHSECYSMMIDTLIKDPAKRDMLFNATENYEVIKHKTEWAQQHITSSENFATRCIAFAIVEGLFFSGSFCAIFWLKKRGLMPGLTFSNEMISKDEQTHCQHAVMLYNKLQHTRLSQEKIYEIFREAVDIETEFICSSLPCSLIGMNKTLMAQYIRFVADDLLRQLGYEALYKVKNPFDWMVNMALTGKTSFFERRVSEYARPVANTAFSVDSAF